MAEPKLKLHACHRGPNWLGLAMIIRREIRREWRFDGSALIGPAFQAVIFVLIFELAQAGAIDWGIANDRVAFLGSGLVASALLQRAFEASAYSLMFDKLEASLQDLLGAPLSPGEILWGWLASATLSALLVVAIVMLALWPLGLPWPQSPLLLLLFLVMGAVAFGAFGLCAAILSDRWDGLAAKETFLLVPLLFLSGTFFPASAISDPLWQQLFTLNPLFALVDGVRHSITGATVVGFPRAFATSAGLMLLALAAAYALLRSGYRIKP